MDIWHRVGRIVRIQNLGTAIFFILNIAMLLSVVFPDRITPENALLFFTFYFATVVISFSSIGEWCLTILAGAHNIKRNDIKIRLIPLLEIVYDRAKEKNPSMVNSINLKIIYEDTPNAYAIGKKTICVTRGLLELSDESIMAILAHEMGHIVYKHSALQLLIGGCNPFITFGLILVKIVCWLVSAIIGLITGIFSRSFWLGALATLISTIPIAFIWIWTKFTMLFLMWSMRQNEYVADEFAYSIGFGPSLAAVLDRALYTKPENGFLRALYMSHPQADDRIARLQDLGLNYSRF